MNERPRRFVLWVMALTITMLLIRHGRPIASDGESADFLPGKRAENGKVTIRLMGDCVTSGVYHFNHPVKMGTVINMTVPFLYDFSLKNGSDKEGVYTGSVVEIRRKKRNSLEITVSNMSMEEKMVLGILLDPNDLSVAQWEKLPGIGPALARRILADRQENGDFSSVADLERVSGIGKAKVSRLECFLR
ncbi:MAG TPA: helix-hairpin-helix domain-containing protein [Geobacteraceae bacterium]|nr:helix-hairpin-helix domain-containing protein [Geobacteraceae bacterium]